MLHALLQETGAENSLQKNDGDLIYIRVGVKTTTGLHR